LRLLFHFVALGAFSAGFSGPGVAREVDLLDFSSKVASSGFDNSEPPSVTRNVALGGNPFVDGGIVSGEVADSMRADFVQRGFRETMAGDVPVAPELPVHVRSIGRSAERLAMPGFEDRFVAGGATGSFSFCDGASYVPTWWLGPVVEMRRKRYYNLMASIACEVGIPTTLLDAVISQESGYKSWAVSSAGAMGIMQIMPGTARYLGLALPFDGVANMRAGARYLKEQLDRFGRVDLALAAYNAGPHRRTLAAGFVPRIPETLNYVATITTNWARLSSSGVVVASNADRGAIAAAAVRASGYRTVELTRYDGLKASIPM